MTTLEYDLLAFEASYYLRVANDKRKEAEKMLAEAREYMERARSARAKAEGVGA
jgi:hypothetical protein